MLNNKQWQQLQGLFEQALTIPEENRQAFVASNDTTDAIVLDKLKAMLSFAPTDIDPVAKAINHTVVDMGEPFSLIGQVIDKFKLIKKIGAGGMGEVYLARRIDNEYEQQVAIKIIRTEVRNKTLKNLFLRERQLLAHLNHPNICRILDGGTTVDGRVYFVMEYIDGLPLNEYCQKNSLSLHEKLDLFLKICNAVQSAHQKLIIHCDLKPSNILVNSNGNPKLLDFGIARLLSNDVSNEPSKSNKTALTYEYASPELMLGESLSVASDVFSLGVILFELIMLNHPQQIGTTTFSQIKSYRSHLTTHSPATLLDNDLSTQKTPINIKPLQWIYEKATEFQQQNRYLTIHALSEDIQKFLGNFPIDSESSTWGYRFNCWMKRHSVITLTTIAIFGLLCTLGFREVTLRQEAQQESAIRQHVTDFLLNLFYEARPSQNEGKELTVSHIVEKGSRQILDQSEFSPKVDIELMRTLKSVNNSLGHFDTARQLSEKALELQLQSEPESKLTVGELFTEIGGTYYNQDNFFEAKKWYLKAEDNWSKMTPVPLSAFYTYSQHSQLLRKNGELEQALLYIDKALTLAHRHNHTGFQLGALGTKAITLDAMGKTREAINVYEEIIPISAERTGKVKPSYIFHVLNYGLMLKDLGKLDSAETAITESLQRIKSLHPNDHPDVGYIHDSMGSTLRDLGHYEQAEKQFILAANSQIKFNRKDSLDYVYAITNHGLLYEEWERFQQAKPLFEEALTICKKILDKNHSQIGIAHINLAQLLGRLNRTEKARDHYALAIAIFKNKKSSEKRLRSGYQSFAQFELNNGNIEKADTLFQLGKGVPDARPRNHALSINKQAKFNLAIGHFEQAEKLSLEAMETLSKEVAPDHPLMGKLSLTLAEIYISLNKWDLATEQLNKSENILSRVLQEDSNSLRKIKTLLNQTSQL